MMENQENALQPEGGAKPAQNQNSVQAASRSASYTPRVYDVSPRDRRFLLLTFAFCVLTAHTVLWEGPGAGMTAAVFAWYALFLGYTGSGAFSTGADRVLFVSNLLLASTLALGSNGYFRVWNALLLLVLLPLHALSRAGRIPWHRPAMIWERLCLLLTGLFGNLGAGPAALSAGRGEKDRKRSMAALLGILGALGLVVVLLPVLISADALFAASVEDVLELAWFHPVPAFVQGMTGLILTPFCFSLLYALRKPEPLKTPWKALSPMAEPLSFTVILGALDALYLLFLAVQSAGLFGGAEYLARRGISYAEWARSGFFQMVGVTVVNLTVILLALTLSRREGGLWRALRILSGVLGGESLVLLASACWRMTLYVSVYGLSFKRFLTYWGMGIMALLFLTAFWKLLRPDFGFCRAAFPLLLAGWLALNCVPVDYLVARDQVDRYLSGQSAQVDAGYLLYGLSYDTLSQLERLDGTEVYRVNGRQVRLEKLMQELREAAEWECRDWRTWSLSARLAANR